MQSIIAEYAFLLSYFSFMYDRYIVQVSRRNSNSAIFDSTTSIKENLSVFKADKRGEEERTPTKDNTENEQFFS